MNIRLACILTASLVPLEFANAQLLPPAIQLLSSSETLAAHAHFRTSCTSSGAHVLISDKLQKPPTNDLRWRPCWKTQIVTLGAPGSKQFYAYSKNAAQLISTASSPIKVERLRVSILGALPVQNSSHAAGRPIAAQLFLKSSPSTELSACYQINSGLCMKLPMNQGASWAMNLTGLKIGQHKITYRVWDGVKSISLNKSFEVVANSTKADRPDVEVLAPQNKVFDFSAPQDLIAIASHPTGHLARLTISFGETDAGRTRCLQAPVASASSAIGSSALVARFNVEERMLPAENKMTCVTAQNTSFWPNNLNLQSFSFRDPSMNLTNGIPTTGDFNVKSWHERYIDQLPIEPFTAYSSEHTGEDYAWNASYWIKAHSKMAELTGSLAHLQKARRIVDIVMRGRDTMRHFNKEKNKCYDYGGLSVYNGAPLELRKNRTLWAQGWSRPRGDNSKSCMHPLEVSLLIDANITEAVSRYVDVALSNEFFADHKPYAQNIAPELIKVLDSHENAFDPAGKVVVTSPSAYVPVGQHFFSGGLYYYHYNQPELIKVGTQFVLNPFYREPWKDPVYTTKDIYSSPVPLNFTGYFFAAALILERHGYGHSHFRDRAEAFADFFKTLSPKRSDGSLLLSYGPGDNTKDQLEDLPHSTTEVLFLLEAKKSGLRGVDSAFMQSMAKTYFHFAKSSNDVHYSLDNSRIVNGFPNRESRNAAAHYYPLLAAYEPAILIHSKNTMNRWDPLAKEWFEGNTFVNQGNVLAPYNPKTPGGRSFLGWAHLIEAQR